LSTPGAPDAAVAGELGALGAEALDLAVAEHLDRRLEEVQPQLARPLADRVVGGAHGVLLELADDQLGLVVGVDRLDRAVVVLDVLGVDQHLDVRRVVELAQLQRRELRLRRSAPGEDVHLADRRRGQPAVDVVRDLVTSSSSAVLDSIRATSRPTLPAPTTAMDSASSGQSRATSGCPSNQDTKSARRSCRPCRCRDVEVAVLLGAGREDDGVVVAAQLVELDVHAVLDVAEQPDLRLAEHLVQGLDDALDARVVRRDAVADEAEGGGLALVEVDGHRRVRLHQHVRGVDPGRAGADDRYPQRAVLGPWACHCSSTSRQTDLPAQNALCSLRCSEQHVPRK
jgi:hypothetical protein